MPHLTEEPVPVNVTSTGFTVVSSALNPGDTRVRYGLDPKHFKDNQTDRVLTTHHSLPLTKLIPSTTYDVEVSSRNTTGTETAPPMPFTTGGSKWVRLSGINQLIATSNTSGGQRWFVRPNCHIFVIRFRLRPISFQSRSVLF